jgi:hypothetical protein
MNRFIAFCGLDCAQCDAYTATQANDEVAKERLLARWRVEYNNPEMPLAAVTCDGCTTLNGRAGGYCGQCPIRACGIERKVTNCAYCAEYASCEKLTGFLNQVPTAKASLERIRRAL